MVAASWLSSFPVDERAYCSDKICTVFRPCSEVEDLPDLGLKLGSLNDTLKDDGESEDEEETDNVLRRGPKETIYYEWRPMYFKLPYQSYLIPGPTLGRSPNLCYLSITGDIPDSAGYAVLGQPFLRNYYTVLDQDRMRIGLAANVGTEAAISEKPFNSSIWVQVIMGILGSIIIITFSFFIYKYT